MKKYFLLLFFFLIPLAAFSSEKLPKDIRLFISYSFECEHFAGEVGTELPKRQQDEMNREIDKYCGGAKKQFEILKEKYKNNSTLLRRIKNNYNDTVDSYTKF
ncbi:hypothetical protein ACFOLJ_12835 [Rugamonas sp. CCM 8940]|uniref:hypothetical protein n=1 Tax=Rugamonas sp. CCM 8940 TaxID=2765359 RepID=UPI0018F4003D|nr:hypothetical protein [Rugamonas sp. CCM 8940]MBJ7313393.1 hypothetical protein [Rugamonas sp. CCM 8940]